MVMSSEGKNVTGEAAIEDRVSSSNGGKSMIQEGNTDHPMGVSSSGPSLDKDLQSKKSNVFSSSGLPLPLQGSLEVLQQS